MSDNVLEEIKTHNLCSITFFFENRAVQEMWKNIGEPRITIRSIRIACWTTKAGHTHTQRHTHTNTHTISNIYCFSTAAMFARTGLNVTLCAHCMSCELQPGRLESKRIGYLTRKTEMCNH
jgi:hypothetical protein